MTRIGDGNFLIAGSHVAHDARSAIADVANGALLAAIAPLKNKRLFVRQSAVHQFVRFAGCAAQWRVGEHQDIPPFIIQQRIDTIVGIN